MVSPPSSPPWIVVDGQLVPFEAARVHVLAPAVKYGTGVFDTARAYWNPDHGQLYAFRLRDHILRFFESMRLNRMAVEFDSNAVMSLISDLVQANGLRKDQYIRMQAIAVADDATFATSDSTSIVLSTRAASPYFASPVLSVGVSSWLRISDRSMPPRVKAGANYQNSRLATLEARASGYDDAILLNEWGRVAEGSGFNVFLVRHGRVVTPSATESILEGITRDSVLQLCRDLDIPAAERPVDRTELYRLDEAFFCGTATEITPVGAVDGFQVGNGSVGAITERLRETYRAIACASLPSPHGWVSPVLDAHQLGR
jgi:branched-chain amino acid aminotransferase